MLAFLFYAPILATAISLNPVIFLIVLYWVCNCWPAYVFHVYPIFHTALILLAVNSLKFRPGLSIL